MVHRNRLGHIAPAGHKATQDSLSKVSEPTTVMEQVLGNFEKEVGGRDALISALVHAPDDPATDHIMRLIADPRSEGKSLARVCAAAGITFPQLLAHFRKAGSFRAQIKAMEKVWKKLPAVAEDIMERAAPHRLECLRCFGERLEPQDPEHPEQAAGPCKLCKGEGTTLQLPDLARQKVALEIGGLLKKDGPGVSVQVGVGVGVGADFMQGFRAASDRLLFRDEPLDAEITEVPQVEEPEA